MDYFRKEMTFRRPSFLGTVFYKQRRSKPSGLISTLTAHYLLYKGCIGFLAYVYGTSANKVNVRDIPIVQDFSVVFLYKLSGLPSK